MNAKPFSFANHILPGWSGETPGPGEFAVLLNALSEAAIVVERQSGSLAFANWPFFELTGTNPQNASQLSMHDFMPDVERNWSSGEELETALRLGNESALSVKVKTTWLDRQGKWMLMQITPASVVRWNLEKQHRIEELTEIMDEMASITTRPDLDDALAYTLELGTRLVKAEGLAIYRVQGIMRKLVRVMTHGQIAQCLPETLPVDEPGITYTPAVWQNNQRAVSEIQYAARDCGLDSIVSVPIELQGGRQGIIVAANLPRQDIRGLIDGLEVLASHIGSALNHYVTLNNQRITLREYTRELTIRDSISENTQEGIILLNPGLQIVDMNPTAEMTLGYATQEVAGFPVENVLIGSDSFLGALRMSLKSYSSQGMQNITLHRRNGQAFTADLQIFPVRVNEEMVNVVLLVRDLSEREANRTRTQQLEQRALLGEITAIFAHEVRNPINNISTGLQLMSYNLPEGDPNQELVDRLQNDCTRLTHLMESVLSFAKPVEYKIIPTSIPELLKRIIERWRPRMARLNVESHFKAEAGTPAALADARALDQVFTNLLSNALNAMKETGGTLAIRVEPDDRWVNISISDTGPGIPPETREKIFEPFYTTSPQGTGLGLAITKRIVTAHKGQISVESFPGGTIFNVKLPASKEKS
jgi:PAS domain S-box-containing protein